MARLYLVFFFFYFFVAPVFAEKRVALVIGNGGYSYVPNLPNPPRDAQAMAKLFRDANFDDVLVETDLGVTAMRQTLRLFADKTSDADIAVVFYAGHGVEIGGRNYLLPVDAHLKSDIDVEDEAVDLDRVLQMLLPARRLKLVILDACRENPFIRGMRVTTASRSVGRGLAAPSDQTSNTLVAYAAKAGAVAEDGDKANSPFTTALLHNLTQPGLDVRIALGQVHDDVLRTTNQRQEPFIYGALGGSILSLAPAILPSMTVANVNKNATPSAVNVGAQMNEPSQPERVIASPRASTMPPHQDSQEADWKNLAVEIGSRIVLSSAKKKSNWADISRLINNSITEILRAAEDSRLEAIGKPYAVFFKTDDKSATFQLCLPISKVGPLTQNWVRTFKISNQEAGRALKFQHRGAYSNIDSTYESISKYLDDHKVPTRSMIIEEYLDAKNLASNSNQAIDIYIYLAE